MSKYCEDVQVFQEKFGFNTPDQFILIPQDLFDFRVKFLLEELEEYTHSYTVSDLGTAIDSLIDLVYVACGTAIYHGVSFDKFDDILNVDFSLLFSSKIPSGKLHFLTPEQHFQFVKLVSKNIQQYEEAYFLKDEEKIKTSIASIYLNCMFASTMMDISNEQWDEMWDDVQRANMSKERATSSSQSKRDSTYDIIKPVGWIPPRTEELVQKYLNKEGL